MTAEEAALIMMSGGGGGGGTTAETEIPDVSSFEAVKGYPAPYLITETYKSGTAAEYKKYIGISFNNYGGSYADVYQVSYMYIYNEGFDPAVDSPTDSNNYKQIYFNNFYIG